ncbi:MAG: reverse transcriptase-like protein [Nitrososphaera sp.]|nr:reverse transcriptase-like protein [Nitrososphaera sp.]
MDADRTADVRIYTDGACSGNPGPGGWCAILLYKESEKVVSGGASATTSNVMELEAIFQGLQSLKKSCAVTVITDSQNAVGWLCQGYQRKMQHIREAAERIERLVQSAGHSVSFVHVRRDSGDPYNKRCNDVAQQIARRGRLAQSVAEFVKGINAPNRA